MTLHQTSHVSAITLRRVLAQERVDPAATEHVSSCSHCQKALEGFRAEQRAFEERLPFERFEQGVRRAAQPKRVQPNASARVLFALAATLVLLVGAQRVFQAPQANGRLKGGATVDWVVSAGAGRPQRLAGPLEVLGRDDRVRLGITPSAWHYAVVVSIDAQGTVSAVYAQGTQSLRLSGQSPEFLPDSVEFTGAGLEHVVVLLSDQPLEFEVVASKLRQAYASAAGDLSRLPDLDVPGEQFHHTFLKP